MASAIGTALISTILEPMAAKAMTMVVNKVCGIVNIKRDISRLQSTLRMIQRIVRVAEERQIEDDFIQNWLRDLVDIAYEARDVLDDFITYSSITASKPVNFISSLKLSCLCGSSSHTSNIPLCRLNKLAKDIRSVRERFDEKKKEAEEFKTFKSVVGGGSEIVKTRTPVGPFINKQRDGLFLGREEVKQEIMEKILEPKYDRVDVVVIWGMGGIGKTTLAQSIYNDERVKEQDYPTLNRKWLCVGESKFCAKKVITKITGDSSTDDVESLQEKLVEKFEGNRFLIVLDDVWDVDGREWDLLFNPLTNVGKGGLIIITRRERQLCDEINIQTAYNLEPLSEEDSWSIFESCAYVSGKSDSTPDPKGIGKQIVKKLKGHPLALKVVGRSLLNKDSSTWKKFLESKFPEDDEVTSALRWSYNHLPRHLKTCFTYCALFPKGHVLDKRVLVQMWMAHDLIEKEKLVKERPEDVGAQYFEELVNASLLQCIDGKYTMHDLIHDLALLVSNGEFATDQMESLTNDQMKQVRHVTITRGEYSKVPRLCKMEKLLTLYTTEIYPTEKYDDSFLDDVFNQLKSIRVLVLVSQKITDIPNCISELRHLRYLDVSRTRVPSLPDSLYLLYNLQTLATTLNSSLPPDFHKLSSLENLVIKDCLQLQSLPPDFHKLSSLELLEIFFCPQLQSLPPDFHKLSSLKNLRIFYCPQLQSLPPDFHKLSSLEVLEISFCAQLQSLPTDFHKLSSLEVLEISACAQLQSLPPDFHKLSSLELLKISVCPQLQSLPPDFHKLSSLEKLNISYCHQLQSLPPDFHKLSSLKSLTINYCLQLQSLPADGLPPSLSDLSITRCPLLYKRCKDESGLDWHKINHIPKREIRLNE